MKVLVIEESPRSPEAISETVKELGYEIGRASNGKEGLEKLNGSDFDVILLDVFLPDFCATRLIPELKRIKPEIGVVTMAERNSRELEREIRRLGILYYMIKPVSDKDLKDLLTHMSKTIRP